MEALLNHLVRLLLVMGPWIVFATTFTETAFFVGLLIPAEPIVLLAAVLADNGKFHFSSVFIATLAGAFLGDQVGYWTGRIGGTAVMARAGYLGYVWRWYEPFTLRLFRQRAAVSVTLARFLSFVRTLMPWYAGMQRMDYGRFMLFDFAGALGWSMASIAVGYAAGASWRIVAARIGAATSYVLGGLIVLVILLEVRRRIRVKLLNRRMLRVALTGNVASGKSTVAELWRKMGASIIDADVLARRAIEPGTAAYHKVVHHFGHEVVSQGSIDRAALRTVVFNNQEKRRQLESIIHPEVARMRETEELKLASSGETIVVSDIPLLFETGTENEYDIIVLVTAPESVRVERMMRGRHLDEATARSIASAQMPAEEKRAKSTYIIENDGSLAALEASARAVWTQIVEQAK